MKRIAALLSTTILLTSIYTRADEIPAVELMPPACVPQGNATPICGFHGPEDFELLPNGKQLLVSQMHAGESGAKEYKQFVLVDLVTNATQSMKVRSQFKAGWGEAACSQPPSSMRPHGIHLSKRKDGALQLLMVNHKERESVEMFELLAEGDVYTAIWHGCVVNPGSGMFNDVTATETGGFIATVMLDAANTTLGAAMNNALKGNDSGYLMEWSPIEGLIRLPNSEAPFNNGVQLSADGRYVIFAAWSAKQLRKYDRNTQQVVMKQELSFYPDNISLRADGHMVVAGIDKLDNFLGCAVKHDHFCMMGYTVVEIDPSNLAVTPVYHADPGHQAGASVGMQVGNNLYVGSFLGDRITRVQLSAH